MIDTTAYDAIDLSSLDFWAQPAVVRDRSFRELRRDRPVSFHRPVTFGMGGLLPTEDPGYWAVATYDLVRTVNRTPEVFCSSQGVSMEDIPIEFMEELSSFLVMDGERHRTLRRLVSSAFTPRNVARISAQIAEQAGRVVDRLIGIGDCDFMDEVAVRLPMATISHMLGIPDDQAESIARAAVLLSSANDPEFGLSAIGTFVGAMEEIKEAALAVAHDRRANPQDDLMTALVTAEVDDRRLTDAEIGAFVILLAFAGNDTTRNATGHVMKALCDFPDQRALLRADPEARMGTAMEEFIRWASPVILFRRTALEDVQLGDQTILAGQKVVMLYQSANRDEDAFPDPWRFDVTREPNEHVGFGGGGPHYCLGANLARTQLRCLFTQLVTRLPELEVGEPDYLTANMLHGIKRLPCTIGRPVG